MNIGNRTLEKIKKLAEYMESVQGITLARAISVSPAKMEKILAGEEEPNARLIAKIAAYFFIPWISSRMMRRSCPISTRCSLTRTCCRSSAMISRTT